MTDVEFLAHRMEKMFLKNKEKGRGYNFNCVHPHYWWSHSLNGIQYTRVEFLVWTSHEDECLPKLSKDGNILYFSQKIPERFLEIARQFAYYDVNELAGNNADESDANMVQTGVDLENEINEEFEMDAIKPLVKLKLPFTVQQEFEDPYRPGLPGYELCSYPHERDGGRVFYAFQLCVKAAAVPRQKTTPTFRARGWGRPPPPAQGGN